MMRLLVSVRSVEEALLAAQGGADFIDLKEPNDGALGGLPVETIAAVIMALRLYAGFPGGDGRHRRQDLGQRVRRAAH